MAGSGRPPEGSFEQSRQLQQDAAQIRELLQQLEGGFLRESLDFFKQAVDEDEQAMLSLILQLRQTRRVQTLRGEIREELRQVGDPAERDIDPVVAALNGEIREFEVDAQLEANTDIFPEFITPNVPGAGIRITIALDTSTTVSAVVESGGETSPAVNFNQGNTIGVDNMRAFTVPAVPGGAGVNFQVGADAQARVVVVSEHAASVA